MAKSVKNNLVLSDNLLKEWIKYKRGEDFSQNAINKILHYSGGNIQVNTSQYQRIGIEISRELNQKLRSAGYTTQTLEDLAGKTVYRIILDSERTDFPYVCIKDDNINPMLGGCFFRNCSREKALSHLRELCRNASEIILYDKYLGHTDNWRSNRDLILSLLPDKKLTIHYRRDHLSDDLVEELKTVRARWSFEAVELPTHHDRYLIVDGDMEIILTSGFYHLRSTAKELTYMLRLCEKSRFGA